MQKNTINTIKLGIFVSIGILLLIISIYFLGKKQQLFNSTIKVSGVFKDISGLQVGNNVRFSGINIGVVDNIEMIADTAVRVDLIVDESSIKFIKVDAKAIISSDGLMGNKIVVIMPGTNGKNSIKDNAVIGTIVPVSIDDILLKLQVTSNNAAEITTDLALIVHNISSGNGTIGKLFMDTTFAENIDQSIVNIKKGTKGFKQNMDAAKSNVLLRGYFKKKAKKEEVK
ncbi:MAG: MlaD family protein [bacterium]|nr:MlaD family protein [bacterium]